ncbi:hypothetical protein V500_02087 [Pseudogymnoascus sp. VKM F-4518 (FW-2643)]|nr:hypothetical protein V500_02087 [Pseudogymnoascus sp. VKM F-4518 (FW-2643)]
MQYAFTAAALAAFSIFTSASGTPIQDRSVCGAAPTGKTAQTPLAQPTGITNAALCAAQCQATSSCLSFQFGLVDSADKCMLFSVAASSLPPQTGLVAYDIGCSTFPSIVLTASNPTGIDQSSNANTGSNTNTGATGKTRQTSNQRRQRKQQGTHANPMNVVPAGNPSPISQPAQNNLAACLAACQGNPACTAYTFSSGACKLFGATNKMARQQQGQQGQQVQQGQQGAPGATQQGTHANPMNGVPSGSPTPIATPTGPTSEAACLAACQGNALCIAFTFVSRQCKLFA